MNIVPLIISFNKVKVYITLGTCAFLSKIRSKIKAEDEEKEKKPPARVPLSLEELVAKRKKEEEELSRVSVSTSQVRLSILLYFTKTL